MKITIPRALAYIAIAMSAFIIFLYTTHMYSRHVESQVIPGIVQKTSIIVEESIQSRKTNLEGELSKYSSSHPPSRAALIYAIIIEFKNTSNSIESNKLKSALKYIEACYDFVYSLAQYENSEYIYTQIIRNHKDANLHDNSLGDVQLSNNSGLLMSMSDTKLFRTKFENSKLSLRESTALLDAAHNEVNFFIDDKYLLPKNIMKSILTPDWQEPDWHNSTTPQRMRKT